MRGDNSYWQSQWEFFILQAWRRLPAPPCFARRRLAGNRAVQRKRPTVRELNTLGVHFYSVEAYEFAIVQLEQAIRLAPHVASIHFNLGGAYYGKGRIGEAELEFRRALELDPGHARAHWFRGLCLERMGRLGDALTEFHWVRERSPGTREARSALEEIQAIGAFLAQEHRERSSPAEP